MEGSAFSSSIKGIKLVRSEEGELLTKPFLDVCKNLLPILDKFGSALSVVKSDVGTNVSRLETKYMSNPTEFKLLFNLVRAEVEAKTVKVPSSCTNSLLWLTRNIVGALFLLAGTLNSQKQFAETIAAVENAAMDYLVELFCNLIAHPDWTMTQACTDSYNKTLKKWHGWLTSSSFSVAMKIVPDRKKFMEILGSTADLDSEIKDFCSSFSPILRDNHSFLASVGMDKMKAF